jgi:FkbM family methyltransferase
MNHARTMRSIAAKVLPTKVQRAIRRWRHERSRSRFRKRSVQRKYGDFSPIVELVDLKGEDWYNEDRAFEPEIELLRLRRLVAGACVFDLGAHQGVVALALAHLVGSAGRVIAVEGHPFDAAAAERNKQANGCHQMSVVNAAVAAKQGTVQFLDGGRVAYGDLAQPTVGVEAVTVDDLSKLFGIPDVLFIDVDGFENQALRGAKDVLHACPDCYVEVHSDLLPRYGDSAEEMLNFFPGEDFELLASCEQAPSQRVFEPLDRKRFDCRKTFHLLALAKNS